MNSKTSEPKQLFSAQAASYASYISWFLYPQGLQSFFAGADWLRNDLRIMDAGCGTGVVTFGLLKALNRRGFHYQSVNAFDLTPAMMEIFNRELVAQGIERVELRQANVLKLAELPASWTGYDLIITASMLEYIDKDKFADTLASLRARLTKGGRLVLFITRQNWLTRLLVENPWGGNRYRAVELTQAFEQAGFHNIALKKFPFKYCWLNIWGHIVTAQTI